MSYNDPYIKSNSVTDNQLATPGRRGGSISSVIASTPQSNTGLYYVVNAAVIATTDIALDETTTEIDSIILAPGMRILANGQADGTKNGLWSYNDSGDWARVTDPLRTGMIVTISRGDAYRTTAWQIMNETNPEVGTDEIHFQQIGRDSLPLFALVTIPQNTTLSGVLTYDGIPLDDGDTVLLTAQTDGTENGLWFVRVGAWERTGAEFFTGSLIFILSGGVYGGTLWAVANFGAIVVGTTVIAFLNIDQLYAGTTAQTLRHSGVKFIPTNSILNTGTQVGIGHASTGTIAVGATLDVSGQIKATALRIGSSATAGHMLFIGADGVVYIAAAPVPTGTDGDTLYFNTSNVLTSAKHLRMLTTGGGKHLVRIGRATSDESSSSYIFIVGNDEYGDSAGGKYSLFQSPVQVWDSVEIKGQTAALMSLEPGTLGSAIVVRVKDSQSVPVFLLQAEGGGTIISFDKGGGAIFNEQGFSDADFRVEGDTDTHLIFVDASTDNAGIGKSAPETKLHVGGAATVDRYLATRENPDQLVLAAGDNDDVDLGGYSIVEIIPDGGGSAITGFDGGANGYRLTIHTAPGSGSVTLKYLDAGSDTQNRIWNVNGSDLPVVTAELFWSVQEEFWIVTAYTL